LNAGVARDASPRACIAITNVDQLKAMRNNLAGDYCLASDIDAGTEPNFVPVGDATTPFTGSLDGRGHVVRNLAIRSGKSRVGLFGVMNAAVVKNLTLLNVNVRGLADNAWVGALAGHARADALSATEISGVHVTGQVRCTGSNCAAGGILGNFGDFDGTHMLRDSSSSAKVVGTTWVGGISGGMLEATIWRTYATGPATCVGVGCFVAGLVADAVDSVIRWSFTTGPVVAEGSGATRAGGLLARSWGMTVNRSYSAAPVKGGASGLAGGLVAHGFQAENIDQSYAVGPVSSTGATTGGLAADVFGGASVTNSYWDTETTGQATSAAGTGMTTAQLRGALPTGFGSSWGITAPLSYPFLTPQIDFVSPLATLVRTSKVFTFLPISQHEALQYNTPPADSDLTALATVYTMIARAIGITQNVPQLTNAAIDKYFWDEAAQTTRWRGAVKDYASLGTLTTIGAVPIDAANVTGAMDNEQLVILRGRYVTEGGDPATHWMLGTLYRKDGLFITAIIAHDPWTGQQVTIDPATKRVVVPADFPLENFKVNGYRPVTVN
jgi:hypothetical protein